MDVAEAVSSVPAALDLCVNFIDVAPFYGATQAEAVLGQALNGDDLLGEIETLVGPLLNTAWRTGPPD